MFAAGSEELEEILEKCDEFILSFAIGQEEGEEDGEVARPDYQLAGKVFC